MSLARPSFATATNAEFARTPFPCYLALALSKERASMARKTSRKAADVSPPSLGDWARQRLFKHFGLAGLIVAAALSTAAVALINWDHTRTIPGIRQIVSYFERDSIPHADPARFSVAVTRLENDPERQQERLITRLLSDFDGIQVISIDRLIPTSGSVPEKAWQAGDAKARDYLKKSRASVLIWGGMLGPRGGAKFDLSIATAAGPGRRMHQFVPETGQEFRLPGIFWTDLSKVLQLLVLSSSSQFQARSGRPVATELMPFVAQVRTLVNPPRARAEWPPNVRNSVRVILADALWRLWTETGNRDQLTEAIAIYEDVLAQVDKRLEPQRWAAIQRSLGATYTELGGVADGTAEYGKAVAALEAAAHVYEGKAGGEDWASIQHNLATTELSIAERSQPAAAAPLIDRAIARYTSVIGSARARGDTRGWASAQNDRALAFKTRAERAGDARQARADYDRAAAGYRLALRVHRVETVPQLYAATEVNLGVSLLDAGTLARDKALVEQSIPAFKDALRVYTPTSFPADWAEATNSLGNALATLGELTSSPRLLRQARDQFDNVHRLHPRAKFPHEWAMVENNRGSVLWALSKVKRDRQMLIEAAQAFDAARLAFAGTGDSFNTSRAARNLADVREAARNGEFR
jgi:tetratricopeptide (TPR) repeat protein